LSLRSASQETIEGAWEKEIFPRLIWILMKFSKEKKFSNKAQKA